MQQTLKQASARLVAFFAAMCMVMAMVPVMAFATDATAGTINLKATVLEVTSGTTGDLHDLLNTETIDGDAHYDFVAASGTSSAFTVNKHSGIVTASTVSASATGTVTIYLMAGSAPTGNSGKPCTDYTILDQETVTVSVVTSSTYGYQGNNMTMKMTSPAVTSYSGGNSTGWVNNLAASTPSDGYYNFTVKLSSGFKSYNTALAFADINAGNVKVTNYTDPENIATYSLVAANTGNVVIDSVDSDTKTVVVKVASSVVTTGSTSITFGTGFRGNNASNTLGCPISFEVN